MKRLLCLRLPNHSLISECPDEIDGPSCCTSEHRTDASDGCCSGDARFHLRRALLECLEESDIDPR